MKKVLFFIPRFTSGGAEAFIVNVSERLVRMGYRCDIVSIDGSPSVYDERLRAAGVSRTMLLRKKGGNPALLYLTAYKAFASFMAEHVGEYDVAHFNLAQGEDLPFIWQAKRVGIPTRILHSHCSSVNSLPKLLGHKLGKALFRDVATCFMACSDLAAKWLIPKTVFRHGSYSIISNGIEIDRFRFSSLKRATARKALGLSDELCFINVGRLSMEKNQGFLLESFKRIKRIRPDSVLLCVGDGPLLDRLQEEASLFGISDSVRWLGLRDDVDGLLCASDCFLLPSLFEGFPFCLVEAQASGLPCVVSSAVSSQCAITDLCATSPLDSNVFADHALASALGSHDKRIEYAKIVSDRGFDVEQTANALMRAYEGR